MDQWESQEVNVLSLRVGVPRWESGRNGERDFPVSLLDNNVLPTSGEKKINPFLNLFQPRPAPTHNSRPPLGSSPRPSCSRPCPQPRPVAPAPPRRLPPRPRPGPYRSRGASRREEEEREEAEGEGRRAGSSRPAPRSPSVAADSPQTARPLQIPRTATSVSRNATLRWRC